MSRVLLGVTGGIAAYKACELVRGLRMRGHEVRVVATPNALRFVSSLTLQTLSGQAVRSELFSLNEESEISHIELADWAEVSVVAPASAGFLARIAHGMADDLLATICLAARAPLIVAPAMNVNMYRHPATQANLDRLGKRGVVIVGPDTGELACGWEGEGRLVEIEKVLGAIEQQLAPGTYRDEVVLVTAGPTVEAVDPVRVLTNRSSGKMGFALAEAAARRGAEVILVAGPVALATPYGVERIDVESAEQMREAALQALDRATIVIMAAAVADYRVATRASQKIKRHQREALTLELVRNPDILAELVEREGRRLVVGFAAETERVLENARDKLARKGCDLMIANDVSRSDTGFDVDRNEVWILGPGHEDVEPVPAASKREVAERI
ncbi:MAG: bifunctional phosphopantothenoylcysteine decarboxylase/phosphopantothenate--cysteine ligase CoaBC, partial [Deltaproteobacteria bacterium]|nr:bifunctional phosphopantothenoylcysteine decarboxylase/phosphopantothenate--cysteine ligase CoaBC [Deltaproteobacteria bacterium]